jgi:hypothetical protein
MAYDYSDLVEKTRRWAEQACASGWINPMLLQLSQFDTRTPEALFPSSGLEQALVPGRLLLPLWAARCW